MGSFTQAYIQSVNPPVQNGTQLLLSWIADPPASLPFFQVYEDSALRWFGQTQFTSVPLPTSVARITIGSVAAADRSTNFSASFGYPQTRALLEWEGGTFEAPDIASFNVYTESTPGAGANYSVPVANIAAYPGGIIVDGFGLGEFGGGGFGASESDFEWESAPLTTGLWHFAVSPVDMAGNVGTAATTSVQIYAPPIEVAPFTDRSRMHYAFNNTTEIAVLTWNASPSA